MHVYKVEDQKLYLKSSKNGRNRVETIKSKFNQLGLGRSGKWFGSGQIVRDHVWPTHRFRLECRWCIRVNYWHNGRGCGSRTLELKMANLTMVVATKIVVGGDRNLLEKGLTGCVGYLTLEQRLTIVYRCKLQSPRTRRGVIQSTWNIFGCSCVCTEKHGLEELTFYTAWRVHVKAKC